VPSPALRTDAEEFLDLDVPLSTDYSSSIGI